MTWTFKGNEPIYLQIIAQFRMSIASGSYPPGTRIPAVRELALEAGVNPNTVQRAFSELERDGLIHAERTSGRFVTDDQQVLHQLKTDLSSATIAQMFHQLAALGMSSGEIRKAVTEWADAHEKEGNQE